LPISRANGKHRRLPLLRRPDIHDNVLAGAPTEFRFESKLGL
jgi:hypothetical protein